jgi:Tetratricopeptide repeat
VRTAAITSIDRNDLPSMVATLCSYEGLFGPFHPQTLRLMVQVAVAFWHHGDYLHARPLLERAIRDIARCLGHGHALRLQALAALRDIWIQQKNYPNAIAIQRELLECQIQQLGPDHPAIAGTRSDLAAMLFESMEQLPGQGGLESFGGEHRVAEGGPEHRKFLT